MMRICNNMAGIRDDDGQNMNVPQNYDHVDEELTIVNIYQVFQLRISCVVKSLII